MINQCLLTPSVGKCGWQKEEKDAQEVEADHRCQFQHAGHRCPLLGTVSPVIYGNTWYCIRHWQSVGDPIMGIAELRYAEENYHKILEAQRDWRAKLWDQFKKNIIRKKESDNETST